ncbi:MAG: RNB domain-containing ribonuclease [Nocardioidaceae bacterium]
MPRQVVKHHADGDELRDGIAVIQHELELTSGFPEDVEKVARQAANTPRLPTLDRTDLPFVTIDPESSLDLDQALHIERDGSGYVVNYAIADVAAFVTPGDPVDQEAHRRGETLYAADSKIPLHPGVLSEGAASLLPDTIRPALLWTMKVDADGEGTDVHVERALVRSCVKLDYVHLQAEVEAGTADPMIGLLGEVGELRRKREAARGGISLPLPEQEIEVDGDTWSLTFRRMLPVEEWNAQISLLTGMAAASLMLAARVGLLRTMPPPDPRDVHRLHRTAAALGIDWPAELAYPDFIRSLDPALPAHAAMVVSCTRLLRGAGYVGFHGEAPAQPEHSALASPYAHVTAPLRRLGDRYAGEVCVALCAGEEVPGWVLDALDELPATLQASGRRAHQYERAVLDLVEAAVLRPHVGEELAGVVVQVDEQDPTRGDLVVAEPAVEAHLSSEHELPLGADVRARLVEADTRTRTVRFEL